MRARTANAGRARGKASPSKSLDASPLAPRAFPSLPPLAGVRMATGRAEIKYRDRTDVLLAVLAPGTQVAGAFTKSKTAAAPVEWCRRHVGGLARALVVNSGNANAFTGGAGMEAVKAVARAAADAIGCTTNDVFLASTGVIGEPLPHEKITRVLSALAEKASAGGWRQAAEAMMTTDTFPKLATAAATIDGRKVIINGICKGSGMIAPDMATMLAFVFTDANLPAKVLQPLLRDGAAKSFNCITVDGDTSTSDTLLLFATGKGGAHAAVKSPNDRMLSDFKDKLDSVLLDLALQVVKDGEGAQKLIQIDVIGAKSDQAAKRIAFSIANSPLVKTAIAGGDANWGRVVMAVGKAGEAADRDRLKIAFGGHVVAEKGERAPGYKEVLATKAVTGRMVHIEVGLGLGKGAARVWTCDLTEEYIRINGSYRT
ncbi:MAG: bifunctional glutamate N-acetyltransferase/amino-acid acetyltransferase ArgJ [Alphaproteobacteria bacterium]